MSSHAQSFVDDVPEALLASTAFLRVEREIANVPDDELVTINVDIPDATLMVMGQLPRIGSLRAQFERLPGLDLERIDGLQVYMLAAMHAHTSFLATPSPSQGSDALRRLQQMRGDMMDDVIVLRRRGLLPERLFEPHRAPAATEAIIEEVLSLCQALRSAWGTIADRTALSEQDLRDAELLARQLHESIAKKAAGDTQVARAALTRRKAYTLFFRAYDEVRRAVGYLRWHEGDAEAIAPSLFAGRGKGKSRRPRAHA